MGVVWTIMLQILHAMTADLQVINYKTSQSRSLQSTFTRFSLNNVAALAEKILW